LPVIQDRHAVGVAQVVGDTNTLDLVLPLTDVVARPPRSGFAFEAPIAKVQGFIERAAPGSSSLKSSPKGSATELAVNKRL
jgi:hypothetical protein